MNFENLGKTVTVRTETTEIVVQVFMFEARFPYQMKEKVAEKLRGTSGFLLQVAERLEEL